MDWTYAAAAPFAYLCAGSLKFVINSAREKRPAFGRIGMGSFPSTHTSIVSSITFLVLLREGVESPLFGLAVAIGLIVIIDALDLRRKVGEHATAINRIVGTAARDPTLLRESIGHKPLEVVGGILTGAACALVLSCFG